MPTDQQMEMKLKKQTKKYGTNKQCWITLKMEDALELFCVDCRETMSKLFSGKWVFISKGFRDGIARSKKMDMINELIAKDYDRKQIAEKMGFRSQQSLQYYLNFMYKMLD